MKKILGMLFGIGILTGCGPAKMPADSDTAISDSDSVVDTADPFVPSAESCGQNITLTLREEWGAPLLTQNADTIDVTDMASLMQGVANEVYPPHPIWPSTDDFGDIYDFGDELCSEYGICWGWDTLDWAAGDNGRLDTMVVHHTAGRLDSCDDYVVYVTNLHTYTNGWGDIGYNIIACVDDEGSHVYEGRWSGNNDTSRDPWAGLSIQGAHAYPNEGRVGVALVGDFTSTEPSQEESALLTAVVARMTYETDLRPQTIVGHQDLEATICPGTIEDALPAMQEHVNACREAGF